MIQASGSTIPQDMGRRFPSNGVDYPLRFFNMMHFQRPKALADIFKWCIILAENHGILDVICDTLARYPVTPITVTGDTGSDKNWWNKLLNDDLGIREELVANGKDYYHFGNTIVSIVPPFNRYLICPKCKTYKAHCINGESETFAWKYNGWKFIGNCKNVECKAKNIEMKVKDELLTGDEFAKRIRIQRWPVTHIEIKSLSVAGKKRIFYKIEEKYKKGIMKGDKFVVANIPETFIKAVQQNPNNPIIELPENLTFHYKYESVTEAESTGLAKPFFMSAWKDIFMSFVLRKAQETIASDHLIPNRFIFPASQGEGHPLAKIDGAAWRQQVQTMLKRQQNDPNEIGILSNPVGYLALGGQGKNMSLVQEIEMQDRRILVQLGIPPELIYGGMTWSGGNVALRMLENKFLYYVNKQNRFLQFLVDYIAQVTDKKAPQDVRLKPFKMADDIQQINLLSGLGAQGRISETTALSIVGEGINLTQEAEQMEKDLDARRRIAKVRAELAALEGAASGKISTLEQIKTQFAGQDLQNNTATMMGSNLADGLILQTPQGVINRYNSLPQIERTAFLSKLQVEQPAIYNQVISYLFTGVSEQSAEAKAPGKLENQ